MQIINKFKTLFLDESIFIKVQKIKKAVYLIYNTPYFKGFFRTKIRLLKFDLISVILKNEVDFPHVFAIFFDNSFFWMF
jgi:hypothetical protein